MAKARITYICSSCGFRAPQWLGRCPECSSWETMTAEKEQKQQSSLSAPGSVSGPVPLSKIPEQTEDRLLTGLPELDRVLGGGAVPGAVVLLAGDPGIGKSTLLLQAAAQLGSVGARLLYVSGEESLIQLRLRAERLGLDLNLISAISETCLEDIQEIALNNPFEVLAVDSIQSVFSRDIASAPGSLTQIRECSARLIMLAKSRNKPLFLVGHVTKEGGIAGPKILEHMVDTVLYFEGERTHNLRILRSFKNRFGSVNEIGVFEMTGKGLTGVENPSALFLSERSKDAPGSVVVPTIEGTRPILVEIQALVSASGLAMPRRQALGLDQARLSLLAAVIEKKLGLTLYDRDIFLNAAGGVKVTEPAADLGLAAALLSSFYEKTVDFKAVFLGEIGLAGEIRGVSRLEARLKEAAKLGFKRAILPANDIKRLTGKMGLELIGLTNIADLLEWLSKV